MTSSKSREPTIIIQSEEPCAPEDFGGRQKEFADVLLDAFVRQLRLMHAMMVELPLAWAAARDAEPPPLAMDAPPAPNPTASSAITAEELLPATRKRKKSALGEAKSASAKPATSKSASKKPARKGSTKGSAPASHLH
jgi:hypothetical protein